MIETTKTAVEPDWHCAAQDEIFSRVSSSISGLTSEEARNRIARYGPNEIERHRKESPLILLFSQFANFLILVLIASSIISAFIGEYVEALAIIVIVILAGVLGFVQEYQADKAIESLRKMAAPSATVLRDGSEQVFPSREIVPGDIILIRTGDNIPADGRIIEMMNLRMDESALTGESTPAEKRLDLICEKEAPLGDRLNMVYAGTSVSYGRGRAVVVDTGMRTEFGKIAGMLSATEKRQTPLQTDLDKLGKTLGIFSLVLSAVIAIFGVMREYEIIEMFIWGVALAVAVIPEALPAVVTVSLALGVRSLVKRHVLIRKLPAVETLGATTIICSDKTGTLTQNIMTVRAIYVNGQIFHLKGKSSDGVYVKGGDPLMPGDDEDLKAAFRIGILCNDSIARKVDGKWEVMGDPTEGALVLAAVRAGLDYENLRKLQPRENEISFSSERKRMTTIHRSPEGLYAYSKGAPEVILESCRFLYQGSMVIPLDEDGRHKITDQGKRMADDALRLLALSVKKLTEPVEKLEDAERDMIFVGIVGMSDPPRPEAADAIKVCESAGIKPIMITGDNRITAIAVARELGLLRDGRVLDSSELEALSDEEFARIAEKTEVYARISPGHKLRIVDALMKKGHVVAMTGDGVNDAPALKKADIGIAMGITGTDVSKEASDMILTDDNFASIIAAVEEGRSVFENIRKYLVFLLSGNMGTVFGLVIALFGGLPLPLVAVQILFINLIMDGLVAIALGVERPEPGIMHRPPRNMKEGILNRYSLAYILFVGLWIAIVIISVFVWSINLNPENTTRAMTLFFVTLIACRIFNGFCCRSVTESVFRKNFPPNRWLYLSSFVSALLTMCIIYVPPLQPPFQVTALYPSDWPVVIVASSSVMIYVEIWKAIRRLRFRKRNEGQGK